MPFKEYFDSLKDDFEQYVKSCIETYCENSVITQDLISFESELTEKYRKYGLPPELDDSNVDLNDSSDNRMEVWEQEVFLPYYDKSEIDCLRDKYSDVITKRLFKSFFEDYEI